MAVPRWDKDFQMRDVSKSNFPYSILSILLSGIGPSPWGRAVL